MSGAITTTMSVCASWYEKDSRWSIGLVHEHQKDDERREAVEKIDMDAPLLEPADPRGCALGDAGDRQIDPVPQPVLHRGEVRRPRVERRRHVPLDPEKRLEDLLDRLAESLGRVLHAG